jgi:hypothetical protein
VPGEIVRVVPEKRWVYGGQESIEGEIKATCIEARALGLKPLELKREGMWDPKEMDWDEEGPTVAEWTKMLPVNARESGRSMRCSRLCPERTSRGR